MISANKPNDLKKILGGVHGTVFSAVFKRLRASVGREFVSTRLKFKTTLMYSPAPVEKLS